MTVPVYYVNASKDFERFLVDVRDIGGLVTTHRAYTVTEGVLLAFRRRLDPKGVALFATALPPVLRAIFIANWEPGPPTRSFDDSDAELTKEVQSLRADHNSASETSVRDVAQALRKNVDEQDFDEMLAKLPPGAARFWRKE